MKGFLTGLGIGLGVAAVVAVLAFALRDEEDGADPAAAPPAATQAVPGTASEDPVDTQGGGNVPGLARAYCEVEQRDPDDFVRQYGSGDAAMDTCIARETAAAARECDRDRAGDPGDFQREFGGSDAAAIERCVKYELRSF